MPKASWVKLRDPFQRVIAAGVAIAGEIAHGTEHAEDGCSRGRLQSFTKVAEKSHRSGPEQLVESGKVVRLGCHISFMASQSHYLPALHKLFRTRPVALLSDLRKALQTPSRTTVFRVLSSMGYLASYSHAGRYYTLKRIPQFDPRGLWHYRQIGFSSQRTLRATLVHLVETSPAGQTHEELQDV